jgi:hypothetical protein
MIRGPIGSLSQESAQEGENSRGVDEESLLSGSFSSPATESTETGTGRPVNGGSLVENSFGSGGATESTESSGVRPVNPQSLVGASFSGVAIESTGTDGTRPVNPFALTNNSFGG